MKRTLGWLAVAAAGIAVVYLLNLAFGFFRLSPWPSDALLVPRDVPSLGEALERAAPGDTIVLQLQGAPYGSIRLDVPDVTLLAARDGVAIVGTGNEPALRVAAEGVTIRGFRVTSEGVGLRVEAGDAVVEDLVIQRAPVGIQLAGVRRSFFRDLRVTADLIGIELVSSSGNRFEGVEVAEASDASIKLLQSEANVFEDLSVLGPGVGLLFEQGSARNEIRSASIRGSAAAGVEIRASNDNVLLDCTIEESRVGVLLATATGNSVLEGSVLRSTDAGILLEQAAGNRIVGQTIDSCGASGVILEQSGENTLSHNAIARCIEAGIRLGSSDRNLLLANRISESAIAVVLKGSEGNRLLRNTVEGADVAGILVESSSGNRLLDNEIQRGTFGVVLIEAPANVVRRNRLRQLAVGGLVHLAGSGGSEFSENSVLACGAGLLIGGAGDVDVLDNRLAENDVGVLLFDPRPGILMEGNRLERNRIGLEQAESSDTRLEHLSSLGAVAALADGVISPPRMSSNIFAGSREADIVNRVDQPIYAAGNWWGGKGENDAVARVSGNVLLEESAWTGTVAVGTEDTVVQRILGRILQSALETAGYRVIDLIGIGGGNRLAEALRARDVDLIWWSADPILAEDERHVVSVPARVGWVALASPAFVERLSEATLAAASEMAGETGETVRFTAPESFGEESFSALATTYGFHGAAAGITWAREQNEAEALAKLGAVDVALIGGLEETLTSSGFQPLTDDLGALESSSLVVVLRSDTLLRHPDVEDLLSGLALQLTTDALHRLTTRVRLLGRDLEDVVREFMGAHDGTAN
jgi:osmoprotectant transport system substrate-binding protein